MTDGVDGDVGGGLHEGQLGWRLDHAAGVDDVLAGNNLAVEAGKFLDVVDDEVASRVLDGKRAVGGTAQRLGDDLEGALVFVPGADVGLDLQGFLDGGNLEKWRDDERLAFGGDQGSRGALGAPPADAGEVFEGGAGFDEDCGDLLTLQERLNFSNASCALTSINWSYPLCGV